MLGNRAKLAYSFTGAHYTGQYDIDNYPIWSSDNVLAVSWDDSATWGPGNSRVTLQYKHADGYIDTTTFTFPSGAYGLQ